MAKSGALSCLRAAIAMIDSYSAATPADVRSFRPLHEDPRGRHDRAAGFVRGQLFAALVRPLDQLVQRVKNLPAALDECRASLGAAPVSEGAQGGGVLAKEFYDLLWIKKDMNVQNTSSASPASP